MGSNSEQFLSQPTGSSSPASSQCDSAHHTRSHGQPVCIHSVCEDSQRLGLCPPPPPVQPVKSPIPTTLPWRRQAFGTCSLLCPLNWRQIHSWQPYYKAALNHSSQSNLKSFVSSFFSLGYSPLNASICELKPGIMGCPTQIPPVIFLWLTFCPLSNWILSTPALKPTHSSRMKPIENARKFTVVPQVISLSDRIQTRISSENKKTCVNQ